MNQEKYDKIKIKDLQIQYWVEYRNVKYTRYEIRNDKLRIITPKSNRGLVEKFIHEKENWIYKKIRKHYEYDEKYEKLTKDKKLEHRSLNELKQLVSNYMEIYEEKLNVKANRVQYRQTTRKWGSCSIRRNITLSKDLRFIPDMLVEYIVYHELAHIIVMAHNRKFYEIIEKEFENYEMYDEELEQYHYLLNRDN